MRFILIATLFYSCLPPMVMPPKKGKDSLIAKDSFVGKEKLKVIYKRGPQREVLGHWGRSRKDKE